MKIFFCSAALTVLLLGCTDTLGEQAVGSQPANSVHAVDYVVMGNPEVLDDMPAEKRSAMIEATALALHSGEGGGNFNFDVLRSNKPLYEKDQAAEVFLAAHAGAEWIYLRQAVAAPLLELHARVNSDALDFIERYAAILVEAENPSADLMAFALPRLEDRWASEEIERATAVTLNAAGEWASTNCATCRAGETSRIGVSSQREAKETAVREGISDLQALVR